MKFSEIEEKDWPQLQTYLDTCLLPVTGLSGIEKPWETTKALEKLQQMMDLVEIPFKGRIVTYPSFHYNPDVDNLPDMIEKVSNRLKQSGFRFVVLISADSALEGLHVPAADLLITPADIPQSMTDAKQKVGQRIVALWTHQEDVTNS